MAPQLKSDTPETDAFERNTTESKGGRIIDNFTRKDLFVFARKLERERNEAREMPHAMELQSLDRIIVEQEAELTQLRKVCDELANQLSSFYPKPSVRLNIALRSYSTLPHVKAKGTK